MKIVLIRPNYGSYFQITPPLSLGYLSSSLKKSNYKDIRLIDASLEKFVPSKTVEILKKEKPDLVGLQVYTGAQNWVREFSREIKSKKIKATVLVGGPHVTALRDLALSYLEVDFGILGEGEESIVKFAEYLKGKIAIEKVDGLLYKQKDKYLTAEKEFGFISDLNKIPLPDWELLEPQKYFQFMKSISLPLRGKNPIPIITSRGCPYQCTFCCSRATGRRIIRFRSPNNVIFEIKKLKQDYGVDEIFFSDDNLTLDTKRAELIFDLLIKEKLNINWRAPNGLRIDSLNKPLVKKMSKSGGYFVGLGIETGSEEMMKKIKKGVDLKKVKEKIDLLHKYHIKTSGFFICGLKGETKEDIYKSINFAKQINFDRIQVCNFVPYPGSEDFENIYNKSNKKEYEKNVLKFQKNGYVPSFSSIKLDEIYKLQRKFMFSFYIRPKVLFQLLKSFEFSQLTTLFKHPFFKKWVSKSKEWYDK